LERDSARLAQWGTTSARVLSDQSLASAPFLADWTNDGREVSDVSLPPDFFSR